jgi:hypothetical protein
MADTPLSSDEGLTYWVVILGRRNAPNPESGTGLIEISGLARYARAGTT